MPIEQATLEELLKTNIPDSEVRIEDLRGDNNHYAAWVSSPAFKGLSRVQQHKLVHEALGERMKDIHALSIQTSVPEEG